MAEAKNDFQDFQHLNFPIWCVDQNLTVSFQNPAASQKYGAISSLLDLFKANDILLLKNICQNWGPRVTTSIFLTEKKSEDSVEIRISKFEKIKKEHFVLFAFDILGRDQEKEKDVQESKKQLDETLRRLTSDLGIWDWNLRDSSVRFDSRYCEMLGYRTDELDPNVQTWEKNCHPRDLPRAKQLIEAYLNGDAPSYEVRFRMRHKDGHYIPVFSRGKIVERDSEGKALRFSGIHLDLSDLASRDEERMAKELEKEIQVEHKLGGWTLDVRSMVSVWTDEVYRIFDWPLDKNLTAETSFSYFQKNDRVRVEKLIRSCMEDGTSFDDRFRIRTALGIDRWVRVTSRAIRDSQNEIFALRGTIQDISEQVDKEKTLEAEQMKAIHASRLASLGELSAGIAHEVNNPLAIIYGFTDSIERCLQSGDYEKARDRLERIRNAVGRVSRIIDGLRRFANDGAREERELSSADRLLDQALEMMRERMKSKGILLRKKRESKASMFIFEIQASQILVNLLSNAMAAVQEVSKPWIEIVTRDVEKGGLHFIQILIKDCGTGVSADMRDKIFEPFVSTKASGDGTGLGLSISLTLARENGGDLRLESLKSPTVFCLELPAHKD